MTPLLHAIPEAQQVLGGVSRSTLYEEIKAGRIRVTKLGRRTYIAHDELERYVHALQQESDKLAGSSRGGTS